MGRVSFITIRKGDSLIRQFQVGKQKQEKTPLPRSSSVVLTRTKARKEYYSSVPSGAEIKSLLAEPVLSSGSRGTLRLFFKVSILSLRLDWVGHV